MQDALLKTIEDFYDCVDDGFDYQRAITAFGVATDDTGLFLARVWSLFGGQKALASHNLPEPAIEALISVEVELGSRELVKRMALIPEQVPVLRRTFISDEDLFKTSVYQEANAPWGLHSEGLSILRKSLDDGISCGFTRHPGQDEIGPELLSRIALLNKHLMRAMNLQSRFDTLSAALIRTSNALDLIEFGLVLYGAGELPVFVNKSAQRVFSEEDGISLGRSGLNIEDRKARTRFGALLDATRDETKPMAARSGGIVRVPRPSRKRPFGLLVVPLSDDKKVSIDKVNTAVMIFDPATKQTSTINLLAQSYGLSNAEARLALEIAQGITIEEYSAVRQISVNTARSQLRAVFAKTDTSRQPELVSLLLRQTAGVKLD